MTTQRHFVANIKNCLQAHGDPAVQKVYEILSVEHESYEPDEHDWDVALIRLSTPLTYDNFVQPICLPSTPVASGTDCVVAGWGSTEGRQIRTYCSP